MAQLPNDLIMDIIKLADGGLSTHKNKFSNVINEFKIPFEWIYRGADTSEAFELEEYCPKCVYSPGCGDLKCVDDELDTGETLADLEYANLWISRLGF